MFICKARGWAGGWGVEGRGGWVGGGVGWGGGVGGGVSGVPYAIARRIKSDFFYFFFFLCKVSNSYLSIDS